ncbi:hypothetical protein I302_106160 [Kwoniella bestiolae CBS 10118]|uniref:Uncharacterized protein n=1 Tax=Kwoniella bestiolae CBS 10118 TaxID=1296100 RepID=A0A1B9G361_9TREE|nr:hypothetical protein I302_05283 [Kwoniella bestiolae CBS 10118]OCF25463.1 hypothetical protein I302_05283 [Kwoniella bestiolae CBS 10118]
MPPSSPTPFRHSTSLIPSSPLSSTSDQFRRKQHLRSSSGDTVIKGLSNWRRQAKSASQSISVPQSSQTNHDHRNTSSKKRSSKGSGLGMGMKGTPGKIVNRRSSKASIGPTSTPITRTRARDLDSTSTSTDTARSSTWSLHLSEAEAEEMTSPSICDPRTSPIHPLADRATKHRVIGTPSTHTLENDSEPPSSGHTTRTIRQDDMIPAHQDLIVPLNDLTSSQDQDDDTDDATPKSAQKAVSTSAESSRPASSTKSASRSTLRAKDSNDMGWDFTIPLNDLSDPSSHSKRKRMPRSSSGSSKIKERRSTPRKMKGMDDTPSASDTSTSRGISSEDKPGRSNTVLANEDANDVSVETVRAAQHSSPHDQRGAVDDQEAFLDMEDQNNIPDNFDAAEIDIDRGSLPQRLGSAASFSDNADDLVVTLHTPQKSRTVTPQSTSSGSTSTSVDVDKDPFGFELMQDLVRNKVPQPYHPSSPFSTPRELRPPSPISFSSTVSSLILSGTPSPSLSPEVEKRRPQSSIKGRWRGAEVMRRIENREMPPSEEEDTDPEMDGGQVKKRRRSGIREISITPELTEEAKEAQQARIAHYIDLAENYNLHVEYVLW